MKIAVSACLLGRNCKYNGGNNRSQAVLDFLEGHVVIPVCPEVTGGLPVPRVPVELQNGRAVNKNGEDVTAYFRRGVEQTMARLSGEEIDLAILQPRSPSCGCRRDARRLLFRKKDTRQGAVCPSPCGCRDSAEIRRGNRKHIRKHIKRSEGSSLLGNTPSLFCFFFMLTAPLPGTAAGVHFWDFQKYPWGCPPRPACRPP